VLEVELQLEYAGSRGWDSPGHLRHRPAWRRCQQGFRWELVPAGRGSLSGGTCRQRTTVLTV
jgi:hypothetical protein